MSARFLFRQVVQQKACDVNHFAVLINIIFIITVVRKEEKRSVFDGHMETEQFNDVIEARAERMTKTQGLHSSFLLFFDAPLKTRTNEKRKNEKKTDLNPNVTASYDK